MATSVATRRVPSSGSGVGVRAARQRQPGLLEEEPPVDGEGEDVGLGRTCWRREKRSLKVCVSRLRVPFEVMREMRPTVFWFG